MLSRLLFLFALLILFLLSIYRRGWRHTLAVLKLYFQEFRYLLKDISYRSHEGTLDLLAKPPFCKVPRHLSKFLAFFLRYRLFFHLWRRLLTKRALSFGIIQRLFEWTQRHLMLVLWLAILGLCFYKVSVQAAPVDICFFHLSVSCLSLFWIRHSYRYERKTVCLNIAFFYFFGFLLVAFYLPLYYPVLSRWLPFGTF